MQCAGARALDASGHRKPVPGEPRWLTQTSLHGCALGTETASGLTAAPCQIYLKPLTRSNGCGPLEPYASADIGVGVQDFGPWGCPVCHWVEGIEEDKRVAQSVSDFLEHTEKHGPPE